MEKYMIYSYIRLYQQWKGMNYSYKPQQDMLKNKDEITHRHTHSQFSLFVIYIFVNLPTF